MLLKYWYNSNNCGNLQIGEDEHVSESENFEWDKITTLIKIKVFEKLLIESNYDQKKV